MLAAVQMQKQANRPYNLINNSCSYAMVNVFSVTDILIVDPRWSYGGMISPADLMLGLSRSPRLIKKTVYLKK